jgi:hypothetical protein
MSPILPIEIDNYGRLSGDSEQMDIRAGARTVILAVGAGEYTVHKGKLR